MDITKKTIKITFNNGDVKMATIGDIQCGRVKSLSYPVKYEIEDKK